MKIQGKSASGGIAVARVRYVAKREPIKKLIVSDPDKEIQRFDIARNQAADQLAQLVISTRATLGEENSKLFEIHQMMLEDLDYLDAITSKLQEEKVCAEYAVQETAEEFVSMFAQLNDDYMKARAADIRDISERLLDILTDRISHVFDTNEPVIMAAEDFVPSQTARFDRSKVLGLITKGGSENSHTAIFARTMGIPAVIGLKESLTEVWDGQLAAVDGSTGEVILNPDEQETAEFQKRKQKELFQKNELETLRGKPTITKNGKTIKLYANIGCVADAAVAMENDAEGIGLFRSEFLYLESQDYPTEEVQFKAYKAVAETLAGRPVIIRTLDIGADKQAAYFDLEEEENPAMGMRAIRICLTRPEVFKTQLRAIYRASAYGRLMIMFPMITSLWELRKGKSIASQVREELRQEGIAYDSDLPIGIMIETPAAAVISDLLAQEADFFSLGTNDLTQYTLAVDRQNHSLEQFCDTHHDAVLRLIRITVENAHKNGIWAGICGELAADSELLKFFLEIGVDELSVAPSQVLGLRKKIVELNL